MTINSVYCDECGEQVTYEVDEDGNKVIPCSSFYCPVKEEYGDDNRKELDFNRE